MFVVQDLEAAAAAAHEHVKEHVTQDQLLELLRMLNALGIVQVAQASQAPAPSPLPPPPSPVQGTAAPASLDAAPQASPAPVQELQPTPQAVSS